MDDPLEQHWRQQALCRGELIDYAAAARLVGVPEPTVRQWRSRHRLPVAAIGERGRPLFRPSDVLRAEEEARRLGRKRRDEGGPHPVAAPQPKREPKPRLPRRLPEPGELVTCQQCRSYRGRVPHLEGEWVRAVRKAVRWDTVANRAAVESARRALDGARDQLAEHESWCAERNG